MKVYWEPNCAGVRLGARGWRPLTWIWAEKECILFVIGHRKTPDLWPIMRHIWGQVIKKKKSLWSQKDKGNENKIPPTNLLFACSRPRTAVTMLPPGGGTGQRSYHSQVEFHRVGVVVAVTAWILNRNWLWLPRWSIVEFRSLNIRLKFIMTTVP